MPKTDPAKAARDAAEAIRKLNHATLNNAVSAPMVSSITQALLQLVDRLPQTLEQLGQQLKQRQAEDAIRMDTGEKPADAVADVLAALEDALLDLGDLSNALHRAASPLFHMAAR
ncbi:CHASE3 domain sensor protein [Kitasatospora sp. GAS204A]|uniref:hypothetical protein n=1 Tax=unclassified Kitasatospora TaxID=2633591 RepID=UPI0024757006|nr:hypothetical protein [Kitasatospora sp. GAS204B]MDH6122002.1 CHASE3 domain sensor protein [Kitasatospora sp. GAS204B]